MKVFNLRGVKYVYHMNHADPSWLISACIAGNEDAIEALVRQYETDVFRLARHLNERAGREVIPVSIIERAPSAELRPDQLDQDSLPPYDTLDPLIEALVERNLPPERAARAARVPLPLAREIARRIDAAEYKRHQMAPGPKVTARAFGEGRRYPIAQKFRP